MKKYIAIIILAISFNAANAQQFISKATIEFEVKTNIKKTMGNSSWAEMLKDQMPAFKTGYYNFTFADGKSVFKWDHWDNVKVPEFLRKNDEENVWYFDHNNNKFNVQKSVFGSMFNVDDSIPAIEWKLSNENRIIAGFNCRKAVGVIMDSVYVFAFYTDEITIPGGPCSISGLPGMILGLTIPRMYTSYIATKVMVNGVNEQAIKPASSKKYMTAVAMKTTIKERTKEWGGDDDPDSKKWIEQMLWNTLL